MRLGLIYNKALLAFGLMGLEDAEGIVWCGVVSE